MGIPKIIKYFLPALIILGFCEMGFHAFLRYLENQNEKMAAAYSHSLYAQFQNRPLELKRVAQLPQASVRSVVQTAMPQAAAGEPEAINLDTYKKLVVGKEVFDVEISLTDPEKALGLAGRQSLAEKQGMLFIFDKRSSYSFWMKGMEIPIDFIWIAGNKVVQIDRNIDPKYFAPPKFIEPVEPVDAVLELNAGACDAFGLKKGDTVDFRF